MAYRRKQKRTNAMAASSPEKRPPSPADPPPARRVRLYRHNTQRSPVGEACVKEPTLSLEELLSTGPFYEDSRALNTETVEFVYDSGSWLSREPKRVAREVPTYFDFNVLAALSMQTGSVIIERAITIAAHLKKKDEPLFSAWRRYFEETAALMQSIRRYRSATVAVAEEGTELRDGLDKCEYHRDWASDYTAFVENVYVACQSE
jgi:hypothetical protein